MAGLPLIVILGPTAVGKTALAVELAARYGGEIVSADSRHFYRGMDIGTAKPTPEEQARAPHHLVDIADPDETISLGRYLRLARAAIARLAAQGKLPFLVGGTGQYIRALLEGWQVPEVPPQPELRAALEQVEAEKLWGWLTALDPQAAAIVDRRNRRRVIRALEVILVSGRPFSAQRRREPPPYRTLLLGLRMERAALYARADRRVEAMFAAGLEAEVRRLVEAGYDWSLPAMSALGYRQFRPYFAGEAGLAEVEAAIKAETRTFIRRQWTWFRPLRGVHWLDATSPALVAEAAQQVEGFCTTEHTEE